MKKISKDVVQITTDDLRIYLDEYQTESKISKVTVDNIRRILSSFFSWLEDEDYVVKSPVRRIHKVKTCKTVKETYSDEDLELMRDEYEGIRDLAIIDLLASTGMRVQKMSNIGIVCMNRGILEIPFICSRSNLIKNFFVHNKILHVKSVVNEKPCLHGGALA